MNRRCLRRLQQRERMSDLIYRECTSEERELHKLAELFHVVWPDGASLDVRYLAWLYRDNPRGRAIGVNAWSGSEIVGHYAVIPIRASRQGRSVEAALSLNTAVHPSQRGKGLFTALANETYAIAKGRGVDHVVGVANANSAPGFTGKLSFQQVAKLKARFVTRLPRVEATVETGTLDWRREWDPEEYRWRLRNPRARYMRHGEGAGMSWRAHTGVPGIHALMEHRVSAPLAAALRDGTPRNRFSPLRLWIGLEPLALGAAEPRGFDLPRALRRSPLNLIFRPLAGDDAPLAAGRLRFTLADFDAF